MDELLVILALGALWIALMSIVGWRIGGIIQSWVEGQEEDCGCPGRHCVHRCIPDGAGGCAL